MADIGGLIARLSPLFEETVKQEYKLLFKSKSEARNLSANLVEIQKVLAEAERRRLTDPRVRDWLQRLQDVTYEIDDALDEWEAANFQIRNQEFGDDHDEDDAGCTWLKKVSSFFESVCLCFQLVHKHREVALNIKGLNEKVELLAKETAKYSTLLPINSDSPDFKPEITTSYSQVVDVYLQTMYRDEIIQKLNCRELVGDIPVIALVGVAGIGKTTLAQLVFHYYKVQNEFALRLWVCLSHTSDEVCVTKGLLQSLRVRYPEDANLQTLLALLHSFVSGKKILLVLDNVWIGDDSFWRQLKGPLIYGCAPGSRILATSRNKNVAKSMGSSQIIEVQDLFKENCYAIFTEIAFCGREEVEKEKLDAMARRIAIKCGGSPHVARTLGSYLRSRYSRQLWEDVLEKELWQLEGVADALFAPFLISYNELPLPLKHCFSYCGTFQKDDFICMGNLIRLWMMQGYLISSDGAENDMESKGMDYFEKLAALSFFWQPKIFRQLNILILNWGDTDRPWKMPSLVHDFAQYLIRTSGSKVEELRNAIINVDELSQNRLGSLKSVRVLCVGGGEKQELPLEIGNLIHLRYLDLSETPIKRLPMSICNLLNLHTLDLQGCKELSRLPTRIHRLRNLRHLLLKDTNSLEQVPRGVAKLTHLRTLDELKVGRGRSELSSLADLNQLRGSMHVYMGDLNEDEDVEGAKRAQLRNKIYISSLILEIQGDVRTNVVEALQPPPNLQSYELKGYNGMQFPSWLIDSTSLSNLRVLTIEKCLHLPCWGTLPSLDELYIWHMNSLERVGRDFWGITDDENGSLFPKLRRVEFLDCGAWTEWEDITENEVSNPEKIMPGLKGLFIKECPKLKTLPQFLMGRDVVRIDRADLGFPETSSSVNVN